MVATQVIEVPSSNPGFDLHLFVLLSHNNVKKVYLQFEPSGTDTYECPDTLGA